MPKNNDATETFNQLRLITSYLGLGNHTALKELCEKIEALTRHNNPKSKLKLLAYKTAFENAILPKTKEYLKNKLFYSGDTLTYEFLSMLQDNGFTKITDLFKSYGIAIPKHNPSIILAFFADLPQEKALDLSKTGPYASSLSFA